LTEQLLLHFTEGKQEMAKETFVEMSGSKREKMEVEYAEL